MRSAGRAREGAEDRRGVQLRGKNESTGGETREKEKVGSGLESRLCDGRGIEAAFDRARNREQKSKRGGRAKEGATGRRESAGERGLRREKEVARWARGREGLGDRL